MAIQDLYQKTCPTPGTRPVIRRLIATLAGRWQRHRDARMIAALPRDRLADMGLPGGQDPARRHSGQAGRVPVPPLW
ncbi:MAG: hypothetical protein AAF366_07590 [Pseudomonadota bacterium]